MLLTDRVALVTGVGNLRGIGFATARLFAAQGARVAVLGIDGAALDHIGSSLGGDVLAIAADITSARDCAAAVSAVTARWGRIDVLVNNAGVVQKRGFAEVSAEDYDFVLGTNLGGSFLMTQAALPAMRRGASIVFIASIAAQRGGGLLGGPHYAASKGGILALAKTLAREFGPAGIRVNCVNPGVVETAMTEAGYSPDARSSVLASIPLGRFGLPEDVAKACLFLGSDLSSYVTGASIDVNGGQHIH